jgi:hypothetical protein
VLPEFEYEILTAREREVGCSYVSREFEVGILSVGNHYRYGQRERISSLGTMIYQWISLRLCSEIMKINVPRPYATVSKLVSVGTLSEDVSSPDQFSRNSYVDDNSCLISEQLTSFILHDVFASRHLHISMSRNDYTVPTR